jgi:hypothetical protein
MKEYKTPEEKIPIKMLYMEVGPSEAARRMGIKVGTVTKWASRYKWHRDKLIAAAPAPKRGARAMDMSQLSHGAETAPEALKQMTEELATRTKTALAQAATAAAEAAAAREQPLPVQSTAQLRELTAAASRVFGWDSAAPQVTHNQLIITADQLRQIRMLRESVETEPVETLDEAEERIRSLSTLEGQEKLRKARELLGREQNMEPQTLSEPAQPGPVTYEVKITP